MEYPRETYQIKCGDEFGETIMLEGYTVADVLEDFPTPTRASLHLRDSAGTVIKTLDSSAPSSPDGTLTISKSGTALLIVTSLSGVHTAALTPGRTYVGDLQLIGLTAFPSPWTSHEIACEMSEDNTEVSP